MHQLLTGISIIRSNVNPFSSATSMTFSKSRIPQEGSRDLSDASNALFHVLLVN